MFVEEIEPLNENIIGEIDFYFKNWKNAKCLSTLNGHTDSVTCVTELKNGNIVSCSDDKSIKLWSKFKN